LTTQYLPGIKIKDIEDQGYPQSLKDEIGRRLMKLTFKELFEMGIMQSDPNPSNFTYNPQSDQLNLFDFGATHIYRKEFLENYYAIISGSVNQNQEQIWRSSLKTGFVTNEENAAMRSSHI
jgi:aarF domain-containing kinase